MNFLVTFIVFHPDNYQGGSGKSFQHSVIVEVTGKHDLADVGELIMKKLDEHVKEIVPFTEGAKFTVTQVRTFI